MPKNTKQPKTSPAEVKDLKPTLISFINEINDFNGKPKESVLRALNRKKVFVPNTRKGKKDIYDFIKLLFKHNNLSISDNEKILLDVAKKIELEPEAPEPEHKPGPTSRNQA